MPFVQRRQFLAAAAGVAMLLDNIINAAEASSIHHCFAAAAIDCQLPRTHELYVR